MADITAVAGTKTNNANASSMTITKPPGLVDGQAMVAFVGFRNSGGTITAPAGWTQIGPLFSTSTIQTAGVYIKGIASAAAETATNYVFSTSAGAARNEGMIFLLNKANLGSLLDNAGALSLGTGTTSCVIPACAPTGNYTLLLAFGVTNNSLTGNPSLFTPPAGMTTIDVSTGDTGSATSSIWAAQELRTVTGTTGTRTTTISPTATSSQGMMLTITGIPDVAPTSTVFPDQNVTTAGWGAVGAPDVLTATNDSNVSSYAESLALTGATQTFRQGYADMISSPGGAVVEVVLSTSGTVVGFVGTLKLFQNATEIKSMSITPDTPSPFNLAITPSDASLITVTTVAGQPTWAGLEYQVQGHI